MKCMDRNKVRFFYSLFEGKEPVVDEYGNMNGEYKVKHGKPQEFFANISAAKGETTTRQFGENEAYDKVIVADNSVPMIDEYTILWVDTVPKVDATGALSVDAKGDVITPHDYIVKKVARSLNSVSIAISKVTIGG